MTVDEKTLLEACGMLAGKYRLLCVQDVLEALNGTAGKDVQVGVRDRVGYRIGKLQTVKTPKG